MIRSILGSEIQLPILFKFILDKMYEVNFSTDDFNESDCIDSSLTQARQKLMSSGNMRTSASDCLKTFSIKA